MALTQISTGPQGAAVSGGSTLAMRHTVSSGNGSVLLATEVDDNFSWSFTCIYYN